jgi:uncharacterized repeat protein (TIGR03803 family)
MRLWLPRAGLAVALVAGVVCPASAQTYEIYMQFAGTGVTDPRSSLIQGPDGSFYGTSFTGGSGDCDQDGFAGCGTIYRIAPDKTVTILHEFQADVGRPTVYPLFRASDGNLYGTTMDSYPFPGPFSTIYRLEDTGDFTPLHTFDGADGVFPSSGLIEPIEGELWGTTLGGGTLFCTLGCGTVYRMHFDGGHTIMHSTDDPDVEGGHPSGPIVLASDGDIYGTTADEGADDNGTFYRITTNGNWTTIVSLPDGYASSNGLIRASNGDFIGTTFFDGAFDRGSVFRLSPTGEAVTLHSLAEDSSEGLGILANAVEADDGFFYGVALQGGAHDRGTVFRVDPQGSFEVLHDFGLLPDGLEPTTPLFQAADGNLYGVAGSEAGGLVYRIVLGRPPVYFCPTSAVRRDQMAVFLLKTEHGAEFDPPDCTGQFLDVACPSLFADWIEQLAAEGITAGCAGGNYCPASPVTRAQMAVFLLKTEHGPAYTPPPCTGVFPDVACPSLFAPWVEQLAEEGITGGCGGGNYCPGGPITRAQMSVFLLKVEHGGAFVPPDCESVFADVTCPSLFAPWIEQLYSEGITAGCAGPP